MRILSYILFSSILLLAPATVQAQKTEKEEKNDTEYKFFSFNGIGIQADLFGYVYSLIGEYTYAEGAIEANIGNKLYPIAEVGYGWCNYTEETNRMNYRTSAPYYKVGFNYNFYTKKDNPNPKNYIYGLVRVGWCNFKYDIDTPEITDPVWGDKTALNISNVDGASIWAEIGAGIKVKIAKGFHMGWSVRYKFRFTEKSTPYSKMWYIPGFGINKSTCFGGTYSLIYDIPFKKQK